MIGIVSITNLNIKDLKEYNNKKTRMQISILVFLLFI